MERLVEFETADGAVVSVESAEERSGSRLVSRGDGTVQATRTFEGALEGVRAAADSALRVFRDGTLRPDGIEIEFGVKLSAETGAIIAKGTAEGHLVVKLSWSPAAATEARSSAATAATDTSASTAAIGTPGPTAVVTPPSSPPSRTSPSAPEPSSAS
ncbi:CU044_2847 family protein [Streptomyces sp. NPDC005263]|uniref:CU044_2847 family protein n=1 Tax=Streptomyces sp. NPDC005263 TaxID=3364711 RepID=UPI0036736415